MSPDRDDHGVGVCERLAHRIPGPHGLEELADLPSWFREVVELDLLPGRRDSAVAYWSTKSEHPEHPLSVMIESPRPTSRKPT